MRYISTDNRFIVRIADDAVTSVLKIVEDAGDYETGGVLLGYYSDDLSTAEIKSASGPPPDSKKGRTWFHRGVAGLKQMFEKLWAENVYYLGEWHFHPRAAPEASGMDNSQMFKISKAKGYSCPEPVLMIIGGAVNQYDIRVFVFTAEGYLQLVEAADSK